MNLGNGTRGGASAKYGESEYGEARDHAEGGVLLLAGVVVVAMIGTEEGKENELKSWK